VDEVLTVKEVANFLRISRVTAWRWCNEGKLPAFRVGRQWRILRGDLEQMIRRNGNRASQSVALGAGTPGA